ncbi:glycosyltransferase family 39 protein [Paenibacillus tepidiphilus]|uniref:glycan biosynthesis hexose transferase WsfD n=1 Tax=Paenibacillus tepidiphilus TaxID=2608683 RepID=UPI00123AE65B|nr:glycosyltransferase family 39 protein [Paenibacillus tepidiphilus]
MKKLKRPEMLAILIGLGLILYLLFLQPFVGVADNGDFLRMMNTVGLHYYDEAESYADRFFSYSHSRFSYENLFLGFYPSSQILLVLLPRLAAGIFHGSYFDIRLLAAVYGLLLLAATWLIVKLGAKGSYVTGLVLAAAVLFVFYDIGYLAYFNSLFGEPVSMVFMLLAFALGLQLTAQETPAVKGLTLFMIAVLFLVCSKIQNAPVGIAFALIFLRLAKLDGKGKWKKTARWFAAAIFLLSVILYVTAPKELKHINLYQTVFFGILNESPDVEGDLQDLGLPERLKVLAGTNYFQTDTAIKQDDPSLQADFYDRISHGDVLLFYLKHPARLVGNMEYAAANSMDIRPYYLGNYEKGEGKPAGALTYAYSGWSQFKREHVPDTLWFLGVFYLLYYAGICYEYFRTREARRRIAGELLMLLGLIGIFSFLVPILGDGRADIGKHLFMFNVSFDMMAVVMLTWAVHKLVKLARSLKTG